LRSKTPSLFKKYRSDNTTLTFLPIVRTLLKTTEIAIEKEKKKKENYK
jgi:hypothetical protein